MRMTINVLLVDTSKSDGYTKQRQARHINLDRFIKSKVQDSDKKQHQKGDRIMLNIEIIFLKM